MEHRAVLGDVDAVSAEHRLRALGEAGLLGQLHQEPQSLVGDPVLRVVEVETGSLDTEARTSCRILREEVAQKVELVARAVAGISTSTGHEAMEKLASATMALVTARGGMASCHGILKETTQHIPGLRTTGFGEPEECPPPKGQVDLRIVA